MKSEARSGLVQSGAHAKDASAYTAVPKQKPIIILIAVQALMPEPLSVLQMQDWRARNRGRTYVQNSNANHTRKVAFQQGPHRMSDKTFHRKRILRVHWGRWV